MHKTLLMFSASFLAVFSLFGMRLPESQLAEEQGQRQELKFSHQLHVVENELGCEECHESAAESASGLDNLLPTMETCESCHDVEDDDQCGTCHLDPDNPDAVARIEAYSPKFAHAVHVAQDLACETCHVDAASAGVGVAVEIPSMPSCMTCHEERGAPEECAACHEEGADLKPANHTLAWRHTHGDLARSGAVTPAGMSCQTCHNDDFCQECHQGENLDRITHPLNFAFTHALEAQANAQTCSACHTDQQFCVECHNDNLVLPHTHTAGWVNSVNGGRHRLEAESDIASCMACHEDNAERICQPCHGGPN